MSYSTQQIRNVALAGHPGAGKTTLFEALLHAGGALQVAGNIERGTTVSDHDPIEKSRGHSIDTAIASTDHGGMHVNLIDTPGYPVRANATSAAPSSSTRSTTKVPTAPACWTRCARNSARKCCR